MISREQMLWEIANIGFRNTMQILNKKHNQEFSLSVNIIERNKDRVTSRFRVII